MHTDQRKQGSFIQNAKGSVQPATGESLDMAEQYDHKMKAHQINQLFLKLEQTSAPNTQPNKKRQTVTSPNQEALCHAAIA